MKKFLFIFFILWFGKSYSQYPLVNGWRTSGGGGTCTAPTFIQEAETAWDNSTTPKTTASFNVVNGDVLVAFAMIPDDAPGDISVSGGSLTWTQYQHINQDGYTDVWIWSAPVTSTTSMTVTFTQNGMASFFGGNVLTIRGSSGIGASGQITGNGGPLLNLTTLSDNSMVVVVNGDWLPVDGASRTWRNVNGIIPTSGSGEVSYFYNAQNYTVYGAYYSNVGQIGQKTVGLSAPIGQKYAIVALEIKGSGAGCTGGGGGNGGGSECTGTLVYSTQFTTDNDLDPFGHNQIGNGTRSTSVWVSSPSSFYSIPANVSGGIRSEVQYDEAQSPTTGCIEYDVRYEVIIQDECHSMQFHPNTDGGSASPGLWHVSGEFELVNWFNGNNTHYVTNYTIPQNQWLHMRHEFRFGASNGYWRIYVDDTEILNISNVRIGDGSGQYFKLGFNCWGSNCTSSRIYYDNLFIYSIP